MKDSFSLIIKKSFLRFLEKVSAHFLLGLFLMFLIALLIVFLMFLNYYFSETRSSNLHLETRVRRINSNLLETLVQEWQRREDIFHNVDKLDFPDPFSGF